MWMNWHIWYSVEFAHTVLPQPEENEKTSYQYAYIPHSKNEPHPISFGQDKIDLDYEGQPQPYNEYRL